ncbi:Putative adenosine/adenine deaminase (Adenosine aminohydrolase) [Durusdinium trenchii]|uniref:Adenosine/adenine deaminase (Adenosine aminohydrolase) n=1 Tax=Durusdinium trenchii TaxID=1381693 RepID=A0ABP0P8V0_9DINO
MPQARSEETHGHVQRGQRFADFSPFASCYIAVCECLREKADLERLVLEVAEDASASGALWIEPALSIDLYADQFGGVEATLHLLFQAAEAAEEATQVAMGFIVAAERHLPVARAEALAKKVRDVVTSGAGIHGRPGILGFGLHSDEVRFCVDHLKAVRIAHGVLAAEDQELVEHLAKLQVCLDVCPTSNELLGVMPVTESALTKLLAAGVPCTINSDDPLLFGSSLLGEFRRCRDELKMSDEQLAACAVPRTFGQTLLFEGAIIYLKS